MEIEFQCLPERDIKVHIERLFLFKTDGYGNIIYFYSVLLILTFCSTRPLPYVSEMHQEIEKINCQCPIFTFLHSTFLRFNE